MDKLLAEEPLASISGPEHARRSCLAEDVNRYLSADSERACVMVLADWSAEAGLREDTSRTTTGSWEQL